MRSILLVRLLFGLFLTVNAQTDSDSSGSFPSLSLSGIQTADLFTFGSRSVYDTYLSPLVYLRTDVGYIHERVRRSKRRDRLVYQGLLRINAAVTDPFSGSSYMWACNVGYRWGAFYRFRPLPRLTLLAGGSVGGYVGGIYNQRNSNNPGNAKMNLGLALSGVATYDFELWHLPFRLRYQLILPSLGVTFSPHFGQSYYEIFLLGNSAGVFQFSSFHNTLEFENFLSIDIPFRTFDLRIGYNNTFYRSTLHGLESRLNTHAVMIGMVTDRLYLGGRGKKKIKGYQSPY